MSTTFVLFHYTPTLPAAIIFALLFSLVTLVHAIQLIRYRGWLLIPVFVGGLFEIISYIGRCVSHFSPQALGIYLTSSVLALVAPALFAATIYMTLGRLIRVLHADHHSLIKISRLITVFVLFDILSFLIQSSGAGIIATKVKETKNGAKADPSSSRLGQGLVLAGLFLQIVFFAFFVVIAGVFHRRITLQPTQTQGILPWKPHMNALYGSSALVLLRNVIRVVEYIQGYNGYIRSHEWVLYVFDALLMFGIMVILAVVYAPSLFKQGKLKGLDGTARESQVEDWKQSEAVDI